MQKAQTFQTLSVADDITHVEIGTVSISVLNKSDTGVIDKICTVHFLPFKITCGMSLWA
jgi:hypothetical protein